MSGVSRRKVLHAAGVVAAGAAANAAVADQAAEIRVIASGNGLEATRRAYQLILEGQDTLDAVVAGVAIVEDDPLDTSVGYGGLPNERGVVELDAAVMHGPSHKAGAVAALQNIRHPAQVALRVLRRTSLAQEHSNSLAHTVSTKKTCSPKTPVRSGSAGRNDSAPKTTGCLNPNRRTPRLNPSSAETP
jgi:isoaspartyl peptidase/L-asparaginase-like protein (Ntn-hydrolase superfamily)